MIGVYNRNTGNFSVDNKDYDIIENQRFILVFTGYMIANNNYDLDKVIESKQLDCLFDGPYAVVIYNKIKKMLMLQEHFMGGRDWIYLCSRETCFYFASSLKELKKVAGLMYSFNEAMLPHFLYNGFIYGKHTLIKGVYKVEPGTRILVSKESISETKIGLNYKDEICEDIDEKYMNILKQSIKSSVKRLKQKSDTIAVTISAGYDSNCILYNLKKMFPKEQINSFSIGGIKGHDETRISQLITEQYDKVNYYKALVTPESREHLEEIVEYTEGSVYERGIFLQYELSKLLDNNKVRSLICGECADQIFNINYYSKGNETPFLFDYYNNPLEMGAYVVKKKNQLMLKAFHIDVQYPFLSNEMIQLGYKLREANGTNKKYHIKMCMKMLPNEVSKLLAKHGGSTTLDTLFEDDFDLEKALKTNQLYQEDYHITEKYSKEEAKRDYLLTLYYVEAFNKIFCDKP